MDKAPPRKRDAEATRAKILAAARQVFCEKNYGDAGIREIGALAGVSSTMVLHYYKSKGALFEAALSEAIPLPEMMFRPREEFGEIMSSRLLQPKKKVFAEMMVARASGDVEAARIVARVMEKRGLEPMAEWLGGENGRVRALQMAMLSNGVVTYMSQLPVKKLTPDQRGEIAKWFARSIQAIVDDD